MLNQEVSVDVWKMFKGMVTYAALSLAGWVMMRLISSIVRMPGQLRSQQDRIQQSLAEFQRRYPEMKITEEEIRDAYKQIDEEDEKIERGESLEEEEKETQEENVEPEESKKVK